MPGVPWNNAREKAPHLQRSTWKCQYVFRISIKKKSPFDKLRVERSQFLPFKLFSHLRPKWQINTLQPYKYNMRELTRLYIQVLFGPTFSSLARRAETLYILRILWEKKGFALPTPWIGGTLF